MTHRYLRPGWWIARLAGAAENVLPPRWTISVLAFASLLDGEPELRTLRRLVPRDQLAIDVGAAQGVYTWFLARYARRVVAFEANPASAVRIRRRIPRATMHTCALSDREGEAELRIPIVRGLPLTGWATVEPRNRHLTLAVDGYETIHVSMRTLDSFALENVGFVKIDVEGHELAVLRGAEETLRRCRPVLLFEADDRHNPGVVGAVRSFLGNLGYEMRPARSAGMWVGKPVEVAMAGCAA